MAKTRRVGRYPRWLMPVALLVVVVAAAAWLAKGVVETRADLKSAAASAQILTQAIGSGEKESAKDSLERLQESSEEAHQATNSVLWKAAALVPFVGDDFDAVATISAVLDDVATRVLPPLVDLSTQLDLKQFSPQNGKVDLQALATLEAPIATADAALQDSKRRVEQIDLDDLTGLLKDPVAAFKEKILLAAEATSITDDVLTLIPTMLGDADRTYLLIFQNNAEIRATGGIPGAYLLADVSRGKITLSEQGSGAEFGFEETNVIELTAEEKELYGERLSGYFLDANFTPEFPRTAQIMQALVKEQLGTTVDGVISIDPVAMSYILAGTGPVTVDGRKITSQNAVQELLNTTYLRLANDFPAQDEFFEDTAAAVFDVVTEGAGNAAVTIRAIVQAAQEGRILVWSSHPEEQKLLATTPVSGSIAPDFSLVPKLGVYLNESVGSKLEYYLDFETTVASLECTDQEAQRIRATVNFASRLPANAAQLPLAILGASKFGVPGEIKMNLRFYLPPRSTLQQVSINGQRLPATVRTHREHPVATIPVRLKPGEQAQVSILFETAPGQRKTVEVRTTPSVRPGDNVTVTESSCL